MGNPSGAILGTTPYVAWGESSVSGIVPQYGFTGREPDETGLIYYRAQYYDPALGRLTQRDPIGLQGGINPYAYVKNNPVNFIDPRGLTATEIDFNFDYNYDFSFDSNYNDFGNYASFGSYDYSGYGSYQVSNDVLAGISGKGGSSIRARDEELAEIFGSPSNLNILFPNTTYEVMGPNGSTMIQTGSNATYITPETAYASSGLGVIGGGSNFSEPPKIGYEIWVGGATVGTTYIYQGVDPQIHLANSLPTYEFEEQMRQLTFLGLNYFLEWQIGKLTHIELQIFKFMFDTPPSQAGQIP